MCWKVTRWHNECVPVLYHNWTVLWQLLRICIEISRLQYVIFEYRTTELLLTIPKWRVCCTANKPAPFWGFMEGLLDRNTQAKSCNIHLPKLKLCFLASLYCFKVGWVCQSLYLDTFYFGEKIFFGTVCMELFY